jgi:hypothetical protein
VQTPPGAEFAGTIDRPDVGSVAMSRIAVAGFLAVLIGVPGWAQEAFPACQSQQSLEQVIATDGDLVPDDCRQVRVTEVPSDAGPLCVLDMSGTGEGVLDTLRDAALPEEWWVRCESLGLR